MKYKRIPGHKMSKIICLMREPFIDSVPCVRSLLEYLSENGFEIELISTTDPMYREPSFLNPRIHFTVVDAKRNARRGGIRIPVTLKLVFEGLRKALQGIPRVFLGAGTYGFIVGGILSKMLGVPNISLCVELPTKKAKENQKVTTIERLEKYFLKRSAMIITQDEAHASFIAKEIGVPLDRILTLPNSSRGGTRTSRNGFFHEKFGLRAIMTVVLHSGGLGPWFDSIELARAVQAWPADWCLVFHTRLKAEGQSYTESVLQMAKNSQIYFSNDPVPAGELDGLVSSAHIGVALYSIETLGYRAELMGLASGKIGNYLKCGVPVVATDLPTIRQYVEKYKCGICVRNADDVKDAIRIILSDYNTYRTNALRCFKDIWEPEKYLANITSRINEL